MEITAVEDGADRRCRFSVRAVAGGAIVELVGLSLLMMLAGGLGLRPGILNAAALSKMSLGLAVWTAISLILAAFVGGYVAAIASRSLTIEDGLLHGLLAWATACLTGAILACTWMMTALATGVANLDVVNAMDNRMMLAFFVADALALGAALLGGRSGARQEAHHLRAAQPQPAAGGFRPTPKPA
jgi:hypothetical protein